MAVAAYGTDLVDILLEMPATTGWTALGGGAGGLVAPETDFFVQNTNCISKIAWTNAIKGMIYNAGAQTIASPKAVFMWIYYWAPNSLATAANGGLRVIVGSASTAYNAWYVAGSDTLGLGGWICAPVDINNITPDATVGTPAGTSYFGALANLPTTAGPTKGQPLGIDAFRYGRELNVTLGDSGGYGTFGGASDYAHEITRRWGLIYKNNGAYFMQGLFTFGTAATAVDFRDSNRTIFILDTLKVASTFNGLEVRHASSNVSLTAIALEALGTTSKGNWVTTDNATVALTNCTFTAMGTFSFLSNTTATNTIFRRCDQVTGGSATITGCLFDSSAAAVALLTTTFNGISDTEFVSDGTGHAIKITTAGGNASHTLTNLSFTGYAGSNGSTGNEAVWFDVPSGILTVSADSTFSYRTSGATVNVTVGQKTLTLTGLVTGSDISIRTTGTNTELVDVDANSGSTYAYSYTYTPGTFIDILVMLAGYVPFMIYNYELGSSSASLPIAQVLDRNYQ